MPNLRTTAALAAAVAVAITLAGCTGEPGSTTGVGESSGESSAAPEAAPNTGPHSDADVAFASAMIPRHHEAVSFVDVLLEKNGIDDEVVALAERIRSSQKSQIDTMAGWLDGWGGSAADAGGVPGDVIEKLDAADGNEASTLFLQQMMTHHQGSIDIAKAESAGGQNPAAIELATGIVTDRSAEIAEMYTLVSTF